MSATIKLIYHTAKVRLGFLIMACALTGVAVIPNHSLGAWQILVLGVAVLVASSAAGAFNQFYERDLDVHMKRTQSRPFVTGRFQADWIWLGGIVLALLLALAAAAVATNWLATFFVFMGAFTYGVVYTVWLKRRTWLNIVIGGLAGSFAVLAGSAAAGATFSRSRSLSRECCFSGRRRISGRWHLPARKTTGAQASRCCLSLSMTRQQR